MRSNPFKGAGYLLQGFSLILRPGIRRYVAIPLLINSIIFFVLIWYGAGRFSQLIEWTLPKWLDWLEWILWPLFTVTVLIVIFFTFSLLANLISAPFNGPLAAAVEQFLTGRKPVTDGTWNTFIPDLVRAISSEFRKILYFFSRSVPLLFLFLIPLINIVAPLLWMALTSWMLALEYADYPMGNHGLLFPNQREKLLKKAPMVWGFGAATMVLLMTPILNFVAIPVAVAGVTAMWVGEFSEDHRTK